jgi:hypothetical protein
MAPKQALPEFPIAPPVEPMLAKLADDLPQPGPAVSWGGTLALTYRLAS